ncbi:MAG: peptidylprolyl isomerase [Candidatus Omnitrophica bacterium]|nr:peptidylprolyl isomerase [Candidatus Omnitrophota bacterium]
MFQHLAFLIVFLAYIANACCGYTQTEFTHKIIAVVNGEAITQVDVDEILAPIYMQYKNNYTGDELKTKLETARADILNQLIEDKLILQEAIKKELTVEDQEIDKMIDDLKNNFKTVQEFEEILENQKMSLPELRKRYKEQLLIKKFISREVLNKIIIPPSDILEYYGNNKEKFRIPAQIRLRSIFLNINNNEEEVLNKANDIYTQLKENVPFVELVEKYSEAPNVVDAGDMGYMNQGSLRKEIEEVVFELSIGEFSKPLKTSTGYYIFKVEDKKESLIPGIESMQAKIKNILYDEKIKVNFKKWIDKLKETAFIEVKTDDKYSKEKS